MKLSESMRRKTCKQCGAEKAIRAFYRHSHYADGREGICKICKGQNVEANRELKAEQYRASKRAWSARPENRAKRKAYATTARGREVHRAACLRYLRFKRLESGT